MYTEEQAIRAYTEAGVIRAGHWRFKSGRHAGIKIDFEKLDVAGPVFQESCETLACHFRGMPIDVVIGPAKGGNPIAERVARLLDVMHVPTQKDELFGIVYVEQEYLESLCGARVLVVDDVLTYGTSVRELFRSLRQSSITITPLGLGIFWDRGHAPLKDAGVPIIKSVVHKVIEDWPAGKEHCYLCREDVPLTNPAPIRKRNLAL